MSGVTRLCLEGSVGVMVGAGALTSAGVWPVLRSLSIHCSSWGGPSEIAVATMLSQLPRLATTMRGLESLAFDEACDELGIKRGMCSISIDCDSRPFGLQRLLGAFPQLKNIRYPTEECGRSLQGAEEWGNSP